MLTAWEKRQIAAYWEGLRTEAQTPPEGDWRVWLFLGGRGAGKTRTGAEWVNRLASSGAAMRIGLIGATLREVRGVMVEGDSGLLNTSFAAERPVFERTAGRLKWPGGAVGGIYSAARASTLRGPQFDLIWADEFAKWREAQAAYDMAQMGLRLGEAPRMLVTTTPARVGHMRRLVDEAAVVKSHAPTDANGWRLAPGFVDGLHSRYGGSALGRQEIGGEMLADDETALFRRAWIDAARVREAPKMERVVVGVDPPVSSGGRADACGIVVAGRAADGAIYVLADATVQGLTPAGWAKRVKRALTLHEADAVVVETNQGGELVSDLLKKTTEGEARVTPVHAREGKRMRAEPVALLYETGRVRHVGSFPELEDEMCLFGGAEGGGPSPDRVDALVWAVGALDRTGEPRVRGT
ncbi:MAG: terminase family protein [Micropepsaceae bacterium]